MKMHSHTGGPGGFALASAIRHSPRPRHDQSDDLVRNVWRPRLEAEALTAAVFDLAAGRIVGAHFHGAFGRDLCATAGQRAERDYARTHYVNAPNVGKVGDAFFETAAGEEVRERYFRSALSNIARARSFFSPGPFPFDLIRALLDEGSPKGAGLFRISGRPCPVGLVRYQDPSSEILPHVDDAGWDMPDAIEAQQLEAQIAMVIVPTAAQAGGSTTIFPVKLNKLQYDAHRRVPPDDYAVKDSLLPSIHVTLHAEVGDLILFDARHLHRVSKVEGAPRYAVTGFVGVSHDQRLHLFS